MIFFSYKIGFVGKVCNFLLLGLNQPMYGTENVDLEYATTKAKLNYQNMIQSYKNMSKPERVEIAVADINHAIKNGYFPFLFSPVSIPMKPFVVCNDLNY